MRAAKTKRLASESEKIMSSASSANLSALPRLRVVAPAPKRASRVRLGEFEFDRKAGELRQGDSRIVLQSQPHKILLMLTDHPGEVVTRLEIQQRLWPDDVIVSYEVSINQAMSKLRHALDDSAVKPRFIETVGRRGYRLIAPVEVLPDTQDQGPQFSHAAGEQVLTQLLEDAVAAGSGGQEEVRLVAARLMRLLEAVLYLDPSVLERLRTRRATAEELPKLM